MYWPHASISEVALWLANWRGSRFFYWVMDFNPDEAIAAGWLRAGLYAVRALDRMSRFSRRRVAGIIALDRFMRICSSPKASSRERWWTVSLLWRGRPACESPDRRPACRLHRPPGRTTLILATRRTAPPFNGAAKMRPGQPWLVQGFSIWLGVG